MFPRKGMNEGRKLNETDPMYHTHQMFQMSTFMTMHLVHGIIYMQYEQTPVHITIVSMHMIT